MVRSASSVRQTLPLQSLEANKTQSGPQKPITLHCWSSRTTKTIASVPYLICACSCSVVNMEAAAKTDPGSLPDAARSAAIQLDSLRYHVRFLPWLYDSMSELRLQSRTILLVCLTLRAQLPSSLVACATTYVSFPRFTSPCLI